MEAAAANASEFTVDNVEKAVQQFYYSASCQQEAHRWLTAAQVSPAAWTFSWQLLAKDKSPEVQFFGASCLYMKISRFWFEVPPDQIEGLRARLFEEMGNFAAGPKMVLTRLCVALSAFTLQTIPEVWPDAIQSIIQAFQQAQVPNVDSTQIFTVLLEILTVLPEEYSTTHLASHRRGIVKSELQKNVSQVLPLIQSAMTPSSASIVYSQALQCLSSWLQFGIPLTEAEPLIIQVFQAMRSDALFETALEVLVNVFTHPDTPRYPHCMQRLIPEVLRLAGLLEKVIQDKDMDICQSLTRLIISAADNNTKLLLACTLGDEQQREMVLNLIKMVLHCTAMPGYYPVDEICSDIPFSFWYSLQDDIGTSEPEQHRIYLQVYTPVYMSLVDILLQKVQFPSDAEFDSWNAEEKEQHRCYRQDIADTMMYTYNLLREPLLGSLCTLMAALLDRSAADQVRWQELEAILFMFSSVSESVDLTENSYLPAMFTCLPRIHFSHIKLISQAQYLIASYAEWINNHPEVLGHVVPLMLQGLKNAEVGQAATLALKEVTRENQDHLRPYVSDILTASQEALTGNSLKSRDSVRLMASVGYALSVLPVEEIMQYLNVILSPHIEQLQHLATLKPSATSKNAVLQKFNMLCWLFSSLNINRQYDGEMEEVSQQNQNTKQQITEPQPVLLVLQQVLPILHKILEKWIMDPGIVEVACDMLKRALRTLREDFSALVKPVSDLVIYMYTTVPQASIIDLSKQMILMFCAEETHQSVSKTMFQTMCSRSLHLFESGVREHPDTVEAFMVLLSQVAKKNSELFMDENINHAGLFQAGIIGLSLPESLTVKASSGFLAEMIALGERLPAMKEVVSNNGHTLVERIMRAVGGESPRGLIDTMTDVLFAFNKHHFDLLCKWLTEMVNQDGFPTSRVTRENKEQFVRKVLKYVVHELVLMDQFLPIAGQFLGQPQLKQVLPGKAKRTVDQLLRKSEQEKIKRNSQRIHAIV